MTPLATDTPPARVLYPDSDGKPMSDNTVQFRTIVTLQGNLDDLFRNDPDVVVFGDLLWYAVQGNPKIRASPDVMVVFGRPKGDRGSYMQWEESGIAPQVAFEVRSPGNRFSEMQEKFEFYRRYGVEEYYLYDPDHAVLEGWQRSGTQLVAIPDTNGWVSPRLGVRFDTSTDDLVIYRPNGRRFLTFLELAERRAYAEQAAREAQDALAKANERADALAARLRALGIDPDAV